MGIRDWLSRQKRATKKPLTDDEITDLDKLYKHGLYVIDRSPMNEESKEAARGHWDQRWREWVKNYLESLI